MSTKNSKDAQKVRKEFQKLFDMSPEEQVEHRAQMLSYIFLSEAQKAMDRKGWTQKRLADEIGTSSSYLTQLFRGDRLLNLKTVAKIEAAVGIRYEVNVATKSDGHSEIYSDHEEAKRLMLNNVQVNSG